MVGRQFQEWLVDTHAHNKSNNMDLGPGTWDNKEWLRDYSAYHLMQRSYKTPSLDMVGRQFQEWLVDTYAHNKETYEI